MDRRSGAEKLSESTLRAIEYSTDLWTALRCIWRLRRCAAGDLWNRLSSGCRKIRCKEELLRLLCCVRF